MISNIIPIDSVSDISNDVITKDKKLKLLPAEAWQKYPWNDFRAFCHVYARYGIPTVELILFIKEIIKGRNAIEIGAGAGDFGHHLGIKMTDSKQQELPHIKASYAAMKQPVIEYPKDVEKLEALDATFKYKPDVVFASWVTTFNPVETPEFGSNPFGVRENIIVDFVETFILYGNIDTHGDKPIMKLPHDEYYFPWMVSRGKNQENNRLWVWNRKHA